MNKTLFSEDNDLGKPVLTICPERETETERDRERDRGRAGAMKAKREA